MIVEAVGHNRLTPALAEEMLRRMLRIRLFEEKVADLKASAAITGTTHLSIGQEGAIVGACIPLDADDYMTGTHRSHGHPIAKGAALGPLMAELFGKANGVCKGKGGSMHLADFSIGSLGESGIVGGLMPIAVGAGLSARMCGTQQVCLCFFGDGAVNEGIFHESLNLAATWTLPVIFLCENNSYAMFTRHGSTSPDVTIADRAAAYAIPGVRVDGQDVVAVQDAVREATERARAGRGPTLVEAVTYRYCEHSEFGGMTLPSYRSTEEIDTWRKRDPVTLFEARSLTSKLLSTEAIAAIRTDVAHEVAQAVAFAEAGAEPTGDALFEDIYG
ncbi:thiamine pyrophosphate-dependent dehydrogenase E1 component subunit alpha [Sphingobium sufflavum]|uniref:thiamine pyrophosphate-dependent dehydrogenase E1 component subunit alpha n=1 Tax=Sphingobium sufflavum TaxID=1129547 RepID=UPI001F1AC6E0|nr:thiamine pyrophosphate-dependent dehydrogenase E1 component subunit alpha [Sphingobium sufflavum]MCE7796424.1 thiamine pyrophosphate-dependent dehydrogenase E1 component subunit alpha [Sphingobium sufflavum]